MKTWTTLDNEIGVFLEDAAKTSYSDALRKACFNRAMEYFAVTHTALMKVESVTASTDYMISYPADFIDLPQGGVEVLWQDKRRWLEEQDIQTGEALAREGYIMLHNGIRLFTTEYDELKLWYFAKYPDITDASSLIYLPAWAEWAVMNLACAYMLYPGMMNQQMLRQFQTKRDAGSPDDNPPRTQAKFLMAVYVDTVTKVKTQDRGYIHRDFN